MSEAVEVTHPFETDIVFGHDDAQEEFNRARACGRVSHAWLIDGPRGIGKATLAWRIARSLIARGVKWRGDLGVPRDHPVSRRVMAGNEPNARLVAPSTDPKTGRERREITVGDVRELRTSLLLTPANARPRVVIIDAADDMNANAANALLKILEEPQQMVFFLLVSHSPASLLPTIRSRCCRLRCRSLADDPLRKAIIHAGRDADGLADIVELAQGSVGEALLLIDGSGLAIEQDLRTILNALPELDRAQIMTFIDRFAKPGEGMRLLSRLILGQVRARAISGIGAPGNRQGARHSARWADLYGTLLHLFDDARVANLDPTTVLLDCFGAIERLAAKR